MQEAFQRKPSTTVEREIVDDYFSKSEFAKFWFWNKPSTVVEREIVVDYFQKSEFANSDFEK